MFQKLQSIHPLVHGILLFFEGGESENTIKKKPTLQGRESTGNYKFANIKRPGAS